MHLRLMILLGCGILMDDGIGLGSQESRVSGKQSVYILPIVCDIAHRGLSMTTDFRPMAIVGHNHRLQGIISDTIL